MNWHLQQVMQRLNPHPDSENKVYIIKRDNRRYNSKTFDSYEAARKYVRRTITYLTGSYSDDIRKHGFSIVSK